MKGKLARNLTKNSRLFTSKEDDKKNKSKENSGSRADTINSKEIPFIKIAKDEVNVEPVAPISPVPNNKSPASPAEKPKEKKADKKKPPPHNPMAAANEEKKVNHSYEMFFVPDNKSPLQMGKKGPSKEKW